MAISDPTTMVKQATHKTNSRAGVASSRSVPKMKMAIFMIVNTPAFTTATACRSAETGVGATMAFGSQK